MAGIGFRLKHYFEDQNLLGNIRGSIYSVIISSGPWLISVLAIAFLSFLIERNFGIEEALVIRSIVSYTFAFSLILFGCIEMPLTRYLADKLYLKDITTFTEVFFLLCAISLLVSFLVAVPFLWNFPYPWIFKAACLVLLFSVLIMWLSMVFLSAAKNYLHIVYSFVMGAIISCLGAFLFGNQFGLMGYFYGYVLGQTCIAFFLTLVLNNEFRGQRFFTMEIFSYYKRFKPLIFIGLFYYLGIWVDKFVFWFGPKGEQIIHFLHTNRYYDTAMFLAYLTIIPSLAIFLVQIETKFYVQYSYYFRSIDNKNNLSFIDSSLEDIIESLKSSIYNMIKIQSIITVICWYFTEEIVHFLALPSMMISVFQYGVLGAFMQVLFLTTNIILLYFQDFKSVLKNYSVFFISNLVFSLITTYFDYRYYGLGFFFSTLLTLILSFKDLNKRLIDLNYYTFMQQPIMPKKYL